LFSTTASPDKDDPAVTVRDGKITRTDSGAGEWRGAVGVADPCGLAAGCPAGLPAEQAAKSTADATAGARSASPTGSGLTSV